MNCLKPKIIVKKTSATLWNSQLQHNCLLPYAKLQVPQINTEILYHTDIGYYNAKKGNLWQGQVLLCLTLSPSNKHHTSVTVHTGKQDVE